ncbi:PR domain zinc finger protein 14, partial [Pseudolycoriella hygida]
MFQGEKTRAMDFTPTTQCRLCLSTCEDVVNIFGHCNGTTIASVVSKHFWFQIYKNDGFPESLCQACWTYIKTFHDFYKKIEAIQNDYIKSLRDTTLAVTADSIKEEICDSSSNEIPSDLNIVKCEETLAFSLPVITNENAYYNENDLNFEDEYINRQVEKVEPVEPEDDDDDNRADQLNLILNPPCTDSVAKTARRAKLKLPESCAFQCSLCTSAFSKAFDLANHLRSQHHSGKDKTEETIHCEECKKRFVTVSLLTKHIRKVHEGRSPQVCSKCSRVFNSKTACDAHIQLDHNNDDDEPPTKKQHKDEIETVEKISNVDEGDCDEAVKRSSYLPVRSREEKDKENALIREYFNM